MLPSGLKFRAARHWLGLLLLIATLPARALDYQFFKSDGVNIAYTDSGSGVPVIFLHGLEGTYEKSQEKIGDGLSKGFRMIGLDQRGHGRSDKPQDSDAYGKHLARDVLNLMDRLQIQKAHVVGHSLGGIVAVYLAAHHPERFLSAVTIGNGLFYRSELTLIGWLLRGTYTWTDIKVFLGAADEVSRSANDYNALASLLQNLHELTVTEDQAVAMKLPLLGMRGGEEDDPNDTVERLVAINPSVQMIRIEAEDHISILSSEKFIQGLSAFLSRHNPSGV